MTVHSYVQELKLAAAKQLLADTNRSIKDIAYSMGFAHPTGFIAAFRKLSGETPGGFRRRAAH